MITQIITPPTTEPITLPEAKQQLRLEADFTEDDDHIEALISAARERCESFCNDFFTEQTIKVQLEGGQIIYPGLTITEVLADGVALAASSYNYNEMTGRIEFYQSAKEYLVSATTSVPKGIKGVHQAIKIIVTDLYEVRSESVIGTTVSISPAVKSLLYPFRKNLFI